MVRLGLAALVVLWGATAHALERPRPMGLYPPGNAPALALLDSRIDVTVRGPIVETIVVQRFRNTGDRATEATYIFPLPLDAAVSAMAMRVGARTLHAAIERRDAAQRRYEAAIAAGVAAALLDQERPDVFTQAVAAIPPGGVVEITLRYDTLARYQAGTWELVVPMVVAPRRVPGTASGRATTGGGWAPDTDRAPDASRVTPAGTPGAGGSTAVAIHFVDEPSDLASPTHELSWTRREAALSDPHSDHDAIVRWRAPATAAGWVERDGDAGFAAAVVQAPPAAPRHAPVRFVLMVDRAATTLGDGDLVAHPLVRAVLGALESADRVRVTGSDALAWSSPRDASDAIDRAWVSPPRGVDLTRVIQAARPEGAAIILVSDGLVADDRAAVAAARRLGVPVHAIGIGPAPARAVLQDIAAATGGTLRFAVAGDDLEALARAVVADAATPPAPLTVSWGALAASDLEPAVLPRLGAGQAMLLLARVKRAEPGNARARGELFALAPLAPPRVVAGATTAMGPLARRWARDRLGDLLAGKHDRDAVTSHALRYGLVSPYTSFVAVGTEVVVQGGVKRSVAVPVSVPAGMQWQAVKQAIELDLSGGMTGPTGEAAGFAHAPAAPAAPEPPPATPPRAAHEAAPTEHDGGPVLGGTNAQAPPPRAPEPSDAELAANSEQIEITGVMIDGSALAATPSSVSRDYHALRLTGALGAGVAFDHGARGLLTLNLRLEPNRRTRLGGEVALWLVGGGHAEGRALVTVAHSGLARRFELGFGAGAALGNGTGIASGLRLRIGTPIPGLSGSLRYDAALLLSRPSLALEQAVSLGLELAY